MKNKLTEFFKGVAINLSVAAYNMENKMLKNTDTEFKSGTGGSIEISKEHKNDVLNKLKRGERHEEYIDYYYKLLEKADTIDVNSGLFDKYKDNIIKEDMMIEDFDPITGKKTMILDKYNDPSSFINNKKVRVESKINNNYEFIKTIKFDYAIGDVFSDGFTTIDFTPKITNDKVLKSLDFVNVRKLDNNNLIFEIWILKNTNTYAVNNDYVLDKQDYFIIDVFKNTRSFKEYYLNKTFEYNIEKYIGLNEENNHIVLSFTGKQINNE